ncbi:MAG TPA: hypothetical protein V6D14_12500 [Coleofasciculaceae cyanobacterium]
MTFYTEFFQAGEILRVPSVLPPTIYQPQIIPHVFWWAFGLQSWRYLAV